MSSEISKVLRDDLDEFQKEFFDARLQPRVAYLLKAVAGAGKSHTILSKALSLIADGIVDSPKEILLTSFTNNSARELLTRYRKRSKELGLNKSKKTEVPEITTLHGLGRLVLNKSGDYLNHSIMTEWNSVVLVRDVIEEMGIASHLGDGKEVSKTKLTGIASQILRVYSKLRNNCKITPINIQNKTLRLEDIREYLNGSAESSISLLIDLKHIPNVIYEYERLKEAQSLLDYEDMIWRAIYLLDIDFDLLGDMRSTFKYLFIDESQDLSQSQYELINRIATGDSSSLVMVGDTCQSIYGFRDAKPENFSVWYLQSFFDDVVTFKLRNNYRSEPAIVNVSNLARVAVGDDIIAIPKKEKSKGVASVKVVRVASNIAEGRYITDTIRKLINEEGYEPKDIIVLCRANRYLKTVIEPAFVNAEIPYSLVGSSSKKLVDRDLMLFYTSALAVMVNPNNRVEWLNLLSTLKGMGSSRIQSLREDMIKNEWYSLRSVRGFSNLPQIAQDVVFFIESLDFEESLYDVANSLQKFSKERCLASILGDEKSQDLIYQAICNYISLVRSDSPDKEDRELIQGILSEIRDFSEMDVSGKLIRLATVHSQKGCEAKAVLCCGFNTLRSPTPSVEEGFILYVQLSRAIDRMWIIDCQSYISKNGSVADEFYKNPYLIKLMSLLSEKK